MQEREATRHPNQKEQTMKTSPDRPICIKITDKETKERFAKAMKELHRGPKNLAEYLIDLALDALEL